MRRYTLYILFCAGVFFCSTSLQSQTLIVSGEWTYSVSSAEITEAGNDFTGSYESSADQVLISISYTKKNYNYRIEVRKEDVDWDSRLQLEVRRTGNTPTCTGGTTYQTVTDTDQYFYSGKNVKFDVPIQYRINNVSVLIPAMTHSTTVVFTFIEE